MISCRKMSAADVADAFEMLRVFLREDEHYLASSKAYGDRGFQGLNDALDLFLEQPELGFVWMAHDEAGRSMTYGEYHLACARAAAGFARHGVVTGTVVSWIQPSRFETLVLAGALSRLGAIQNPILPIYRHREVSFIARQSGCRLLVVPATFRGFDYPPMAAEATADLAVWSVPANSVLRQRPGHYYWQAYLTGDSANGAEEPIGPVQELTVTLPYLCFLPLPSSTFSARTTGSCLTSRLTGIVPRSA